MDTLVMQVFCGICGKPMLMDSRKKNPKQTELYQCSNRPGICNHRVKVVEVKK